MTKYRESLLEMIDILTCALQYSTTDGNRKVIGKMLTECINELGEIQ